MPTIKFVRVERNCVYNKTARREHAGGTTRLQLIYDFDVIIDGERRAQMLKSASAKGYYVQDADNRPIDPVVQHHRTGRAVSSQAQFEAVVIELLNAGKIPTLQELAAKREVEAAARRVVIQEKKDEQRRRAISMFADDAYTALKALVSARGIAAQTTAMAGAQVVIAAVDGQIDDWTAAVDNEPSRFGIH